MKKILFLENKKYLDEINIFLDHKQYLVDYDGVSKIKESDSFFLKYDLIVSLIYNSPLSNLLIIRMKKIGIQTLLLCDGIIEWENMFSNPLNKAHSLNLFHPILHDNFLCTGKEETQYFNFLGTKTMQILPTRIAPTIDRLPQSNKGLFLITTANTAYFNDRERKSLIDLIKTVNQSLDDLGIRYVYRVFDDYLVAKLNIENNENIKDCSFEECLKLVSCVITTPSSISLTAMYHNRSVGHFIYRDAPMFLQGGWNISSSIDIKATLISMKALEEERMNFQKFQVKKYIVDNSNAEKEIFQDAENYRSESIEKFINQNLWNMLNSSFNFNLEYFTRKIYLKYKKSNLIKSLRGKIK